MADLVASLVALALADPVLASAAENRVFGGELPADEAAFMPRAALVIQPSGGVSTTGGSFVEADTVRVDVMAYGGSQAAAVWLLDLAAGTFRQARRGVHGGLLVHWINPAGGYSAGRDPALLWPRAFQSFQVLYSFKEIL